MADSTDKVVLRLEKDKPRLLTLAKTAVLTLKKKGLDNVIARVVFVLDGSGSMQRQFQSGNVQAVLDRIATLALKFDDNGELEVWGFASGNRKFENVTIDNLDDYIKRIMNGETGALAVSATPSPSPSPAPAKKSTWWNPLSWGSDSSTPSPAPRSTAQYSGSGILPGLSYENNEPPVMRNIVTECKDGGAVPTFVVFITDGGIDKSDAIKRVLVDASRYPIFWQFVGLGGSNYGILEDFDTMEGRFIDNANFFAIDDYRNITDAELYERLLAEFPSWIEKAKAAGVLR
jgi:hypothetical protein